MNAEKLCSKCGGPVTRKGGVKNGKAWAGWFCDDKKGCNFVEWENTNQQVQPSAAPKANYYTKKQEPNWDKIRKESHENMELLNAKNNATLLLVEAMRGGMTLAQALENFDATTQIVYDCGKENKYCSNK